MANIINRTTKQYLKSVNTPDYPKSEWIINPVLPDCEPIYYVIEGDVVREMTQMEKDDLTYSTESSIYLIEEKLLLTNKNGYEYEDNTDVIINPVMPPCELKYTKVIDGSVVEMTAEEKAVVDAPEIERKQSIVDIEEAYLSALDDLDNIINATNPTNAQIVGAIKTEAKILKKLLKFIKLNVVST